MNKINAYTLMEVTIAMLLSALCITVCYTAYGIISSYYQSFQQKNETIDAVLSLKRVMEHDFIKSEHIIKTDSGIELQQISGNIIYSFASEHILREVNNLHTDTFKLNSENVLFFFETVPVFTADTIDRVEMNIVKEKALKMHLRVDKKYSAQNLLN